MKIGSTDFNQEAIKAMKFDEFSALFKGKIDMPLDIAYEKITGIKPEKKTPMAKSIAANTAKEKDRPDKK